MYPSSETAAMTAPIGALLEAPVAPAISANIVRDAEELMQTFAVRSAVYMAEQDCPYEEEFDGNDYTSTHILGRVDGKPAGCLPFGRREGGADGRHRLDTTPEFLEGNPGQKSAIDTTGKGHQRSIERPQEFAKSAELVGHGLQNYQIASKRGN